MVGVPVILVLHLFSREGPCVPPLAPRRMAGRRDARPLPTEGIVVDRYTVSELMLQCVEGVVVDVSVRQVAAPGWGTALAEMEVNADGDFAARHSCAGLLLLVVGGDTLARDLHISDKNIVFIQIGRAAACSQRGDDASPIGIATGQCALPDGRERNGACRSDGIALV